MVVYSICFRFSLTFFYTGECFIAINEKIIDQVMSGVVTTGRHQKEGKMTYREFVWFLIAEEDKRHPTRYLLISDCSDRLVEIR